ncbi:hypothetical protein C1645_832260 [Glomus cerebriforme]|uniref:Uncharacterized protein n=1 Tax=Glomus cerebriforme TaxID=658196 RepID=A0A397SDX1_9GLOM|nr:hypothetical protein C1645_832260 [Glomus cerebriforme]
MAGIATRYVTENELNTEMSIEELTGRKKGGALPNAPDTPDITQEAEPDTVNICQISPKETIRDLAQHVKAIAKALAKSASNASASLSRISRLQKELRNLKASEKIISATLIPDITCSANKIQKEKGLLRKNEGIDYPDYFALELVKERLDVYDVSKVPDLQALADIMIMLCIRPAEIKTLRICNGGVTGYAKNWGQQDIPRIFRSLEKNEERASQLLTWIQEVISSGQLRDPEKPRVLWFNTFLKKDEFLPETGKPLLPSSLRKLGAVFAVVAHGAKNLSEAMSIASEALRHAPGNHTSPAKNYTIRVRRALPPHSSNSIASEQGVIPPFQGLPNTEKLAQLLEADKQNAEAYSVLFNIGETLKKQFEDCHLQYNTLEKRVKRLERDVYFLKDELDDPEVCVNRETVIDLIHKIVPSLIGKKDKDSSYSSESSEDSDSVEIIERSHGYRVREERAVLHAFVPLAKQRRRARPRKIKRLVV